MKDQHWKIHPKKETCQKIYLISFINNIAAVAALKLKTCRLLDDCNFDVLSKGKLSIECSCVNF